MLVALRSVVLCEDPYGPFGGLPEKVRAGRGKDFLSRTVTAAFDLLDVTVEDLPAYTPHLKGTVEGLNRAVESMFLAALPGYARQPRPANALPGRRTRYCSASRTSPPGCWPGHGGRTPNISPRPCVPARQDSSSGVAGRSHPAAGRAGHGFVDVHSEDAGARTLTTRGIRFRKRDYVGAWMNRQAGLQVRHPPLVREMRPSDDAVSSKHDWSSPCRDGTDGASQDMTTTSLPSSMPSGRCV